MGRDEILRTWFMAELAHAREQGIAVDVEGVPYEDQTPDEVWELMQKRNYMLDYEGDDTGRIVALHIELLKPLKKPRKKCDTNLQMVGKDAYKILLSA